MRKKINTTPPTVRFAGTTTVIDRHGILRVESRRQQKIPTENGRDYDDDNKFKLSRTCIYSTIVLLFAIMMLSYRGYLDTRAVNYPYQGPKVYPELYYFIY
jgi:hypothetical protein